MAPPGRGRGRGASLGGRGQSRGRGRGGRGRGRGARPEVSARLSRDEEAPLRQEYSEDEEEDQIFEAVKEDSSSDEDVPNSKSYQTLLATYKTDEPQRKRRKLDRKLDTGAQGETDQKTQEDVTQTSLPEDQSEQDSEDDQADQDQEGQEEDRESDIAEGVVEGDFVDDDEDAADPFETRFDHPDEKELSTRLAAVKAGDFQAEQIKSDVIGKIARLRPAQIDEDEFVKASSLKDIKIKKRLQEPASKLVSKLTPLQKELAPAVSNYKDVLFGGRTPENAGDLRDLACIHAMNHLYKTRDRILKNTSRLARDTGTADLELRDQGFTRPKVLILLETRQMCVKYMDAITKLCEPEQQENRKRFQDTFVKADPEGFGHDKPADFCELFEGNDDNDFRLGVKFTRKTIKYYSQFYNSDIIFASPLGLRRAMKDHDPKNFDRDFLSSIELLILDQADAMLQQNWAHILFAFSHLNHQPSTSHPNTDYSRIRTTQYLDSNAAYFRQTLVFSAYLTPELNALFNTNMRNISGKQKVSPIYPGAIESLPLSVRGQVKQMFTRVKSSSAVDPSADPDDRFRYFTSGVLPSLSRTHKSAAAEDGAGILLFVPTYHDFVRLRNFFSSDPRCAHLSFGSISEYSDATEVRRARSYFYTGKNDVLIVSGRAHHFRRYMKMQGTKRLVFYSVPENAEWYKEAVGWLEGALERGGEVGVRCLFSRWEGLALERVVGSKRVAKMVREGREDIFEFR